MKTSFSLRIKTADAEKFQFFCYFQFKKINQAHSILSDEKKREVYDKVTPKELKSKPFRILSSDLNYLFFC